MRIRRHHHQLPSLTTAALPDLIFTVLFFFMIVTHLRERDVKVQYQTPQGTQLTTAEGKDNTIYIYVAPSRDGSGHIMQVNNRVVPPSQLAATLANEVAAMPETDNRQPRTAILSADKHTDMATIINIKQLLKSNGVQRIHYAANAATPNRQP